jgi:hypothetical protein
MIIEIAQKLEFSESDGKQFLELMRTATQSSTVCASDFVEPLINLLGRAEIKSITEIKNFTLDCGNAEN